ncbi:MAG: adenylyl-sulfate kinase [Bacteroidetes bacterium HGW-Bacteroidetes-21]|jgi:adenylylsulfate kinase|nr:MAG: adenylyl-sulfate kinase [Bacteroidetes bacterium HGW-Bacteroidetes-21]
MINKENIVPVFEKMLSRSDRENKLKQHAVCLWFTGLPGSGKSTLAIEVEKQLQKKGHTTVLLDGDNVRSGLNSDLGFSEEARTENIRRVAEISKLLISQGIITLNCFVSPTNAQRKMAEKIIGKNDFRLIWISTPAEVCEERDPKNHYKKAKQGKIDKFTGVSSVFEKPLSFYLEVPAHQLSIKESAAIIVKAVLPVIQNK